MSLFGRKKDVVTNPNMSPARSVKLVKDDSGKPAVDLNKVRAAGHVDLAKRADKAGISLSKRDLAGIRAQAVLVLDHSGSMSYDYQDLDGQGGVVQQLVERALGFALQIDVDGSVPVIPFDSNVKRTVEVTIDNYKGVVDRDIYKPYNMGSTNMAAALEVVKKMAKESTSPIFCVVVTDGEPDSRSATTRVVCELASYPVFVKFLAIRPVNYLQQLDDLPDSQRLLDNVDAKFISDPNGMSDLAFADAMADEWDSWIKLATQAGVLV